MVRDSEDRGASREYAALRAKSADSLPALSADAVIAIPAFFHGDTLPERQPMQAIRMRRANVTSAGNG
jgi:hypothetical protein